MVAFVDNLAAFQKGRARDSLESFQCRLTSCETLRLVQLALAGFSKLASLDPVQVSENSRRPGKYFKAPFITLPTAGLDCPAPGGERSLRVEGGHPRTRQFSGDRRHVHEDRRRANRTLCRCLLGDGAVQV